MQILRVFNNSKIEYVDLTVEFDIDKLSEYMLIDETYDEKGKTNIHRHVFFFPDEKAKQGDQLSVFVGKIPTEGLKLLHLDEKVRTFEWGLDGNIFNNNGKDKIRLYKTEFINAEIARFIDK